MSIQALFNQRNIIPTTLVIISIGLFFVPIVDTSVFVVSAALSEIIAGIAAAIWIFRMPKEKVGEYHNYLIVSYPLILALGILILFYSFGFNKNEPFFVVDMWFVILATVGAIFTMFFTEKKIKKLETVTDDFKLRIDKLEQRLNELTDHHPGKMPV